LEGASIVAVTDLLAYCGTECASRMIIIDGKEIDVQDRALQESHVGDSFTTGLWIAETSLTMMGRVLSR
jgi:hypothetical protein